MNHNGRPSKEAVRDWLRCRRQVNAPLPDIAQIRRELGWDQAAPAGGRDKARGGAIVRRDDARTGRLPKN